MLGRKSVKFFSMIVGTLLVASLVSNTTSAMSVTDLEVGGEDKHCSSQSLNKIGEPITFSTITINGEENPLYCTFSNKESALEKFKALVPRLVDLAATVGGLDELSDDNWEEYRRFIGIATTDIETYKDFSDDLLISNSFFDIYENDDANAEIEKYVNSGNRMRSNSEEQFELGLMLPNYAPIVEREQKKIAKAISRASINTSAAVSYAIRYAFTPNTSEYGYLDGVDCTNFVSQILEAGGVQQEVYNDKYSGWWHKNGLLGHSYSRSWTLSDTFVRYMGVGYTTTNHNSFSLNIAKGDFISLDENNDGQWDHMGFVADHKPLVQLVNGQYSDYMVAQHSSNYLLWASHANNNWPRQNGAKYARVRR